MRYESDDDELMNAMLFELQIQIGIGKAAGTPMLEGHDGKVSLPLEELFARFILFVG